MIAVAVMCNHSEDSPAGNSGITEDGNCRLSMLTGDNERTGKAIGKQAGVDEVTAGVLPEGKESTIQALKKTGRCRYGKEMGSMTLRRCTRADIGMAIGAGTDVAIDAADVVLMKSRLSDVPAAIRLSRATLRNIHENLFGAFFYNVIGIPLATGVWYPAVWTEAKSEPFGACGDESLPASAYVTKCASG
ncbi:MAG: hypothetical protein ACLS20_10155 [Faecalimonas umbilicata]